VESARVKAEHACRLAMMVAQRAEAMLTEVSQHHSSGDADMHMSLPAMPSSEGPEEGDRWEEDSVFPGVPQLQMLVCVDPAGAM